MSICDFLFSADLLVPEIRPALEELAAKLGLPQPGPTAWVTYPDEGWDVVFALVNKAFAAAPTRLELIAPIGEAGAGPAVYRDQVPRPIRTHATVVAVPDLPQLVERVRRSGARHWLQPAGDQVTFDRLWMGAGVGDLGDYDPAADGGFRFEFIPSNSSAFSPRLFETPQDEPRKGEVGFRRIRRRAFLVADLDAALSTLERVFGWEPAHPVREEPSRGYRFAVMSLNHPHGAALMLVQPTDAHGVAGRALATQGPGPWAIVVAAFDLEATFADLTARGAPVRRLPAGAYEPEALVPQLSPTLDAPIIITPDGLAL
jgi:hypothetical protein